MIQLTAFWKKTSKNDRTYYQGKLGNGRLLLFKNDKKDSEKHPDSSCTSFPRPRGGRSETGLSRGLRRRSHFEEAFLCPCLKSPHNSNMKA